LLRGSKTKMPTEVGIFSRAGCDQPCLRRMMTTVLAAIRPDSRIMPHSLRVGTEVVVAVVVPGTHVRVLAP